MENLFELVKSELSKNELTPIKKGEKLFLEQHKNEVPYPVICTIGTITMKFNEAKQHYDKDITFANWRKLTESKFNVSFFNKDNKSWEQFNTNYHYPYYIARMGIITPEQKYGMILIDIDNKPSSDNIFDGMDFIKKYNNKLIPTYTELTLNKGIHLIYYADADFLNKIKNIQNLKVNGTKYFIDVKCTGGLSSLAGSYVKTNDAKLLTMRLINKIMPTELPKFLRKWILENIKDSPIDSKTVVVRNEKTVEELNTFLQVIDPEQFGNNTKTWRRIMFVMNRYNNSIEMFDKFYEWSRKASKYLEVNKTNLLKQWDNLNHKLTESLNVALSDLYEYIRKSDIEFYRKIFPTLYNDAPTNIPFSHEIDCKYITCGDEEYDHALEEWEYYKTLIIHSGLGSGKTTFLCELLKDTEKYKRVLIIAHRISFGNMHFGNLKKQGFTYYLKDKTGVVDAERVIMSIDSLAKYNVERNDKTPFDLIVLDESESLLNHCSSTTLDSRGGDIGTAVLMKQLCLSSNKVLAMDATMTKRTVEFMRSIDKDFIYLHNKNFNVDRNVIMSNDSENVRKQINSCINKNKKIVIVCQSKTDVETMTTELKEQYPTKIIKSYTSNSTTTEKRELEDVNVAWRDVDILIYNSSIESGLSYDKTDFYKMFVIMRDNCNSGRGLVQQLLRIRHLKNTNILCDIGGRLKYENTYPYIWTYDEVKALYNDTKTFNIFPDESIKDVLLWNLIENKNKDANTLYFMFTKYLRETGFTIDESQLQYDNRTKSNKIHSDEQKQTKAKKVERYISYKIPTDMELSEIEEKKLMGSETKEDIEREDLFYINNTFHVQRTNEELFNEFINTFVNNKEAMKTTQNILSGTIEDITDIYGMPVPSFRHKKKQIKTSIIKKILNTIGFDTNNKNEWMTKEDYENKKNELVKAEWWQELCKEPMKFIDIFNINNKHYNMFSAKDNLRYFNIKLNDILQPYNIKLIGKRFGHNETKFRFEFTNHIDEFIKLDYMKTQQKGKKQFIENTQSNYWGEILNKSLVDDFDFD